VAAKLKYNEDHTAFEVTIGNDVFADDISEGDDWLILEGEAKSYGLALDGCDLDGVEPNTVYELVKLTTILAPDGALDTDDAADDDEGVPA
jgi:hypothetical protein